MNLIKEIFYRLRQAALFDSKGIYKVSLFVSLVLLTGVSVLAQVHQQVSYQTVIKDANNNIVANTTVGMRISLLQGSETGPVAYQEIQTPTTNGSGLINIQIGNGKVEEGDFGSIDWVKSPYYIKTETNLSGKTKFKHSDKSLIVACVLYASNPDSEAHKPVPAVAAVNSVKEVAKEAPAKPHYVGEFFGGGVIFYVNKGADGKEHGLIVATSDLCNACVWSNVSTIIGSSAESTFDGKTNTAAIVANLNHSESAALLCDTSNLGGQKDWYLPSMQELNMLWNSLGVINKALDADGNAETAPLEDAVYWSSTEDETTTFAWYFGMYDSGPDGNTAGTNYKSEQYHVRAIRSF